MELANHTLIISRTGIERVIADSAAPIRDRNNAIVGVVLVFRDITEKEKLIASIQRNQKLESLGLLAGGIAHDFNNLMGGIFGCIDIAIEISTEKKVIQRLSKAMNTIDRARNLTHQLITFAKGGSPIRETLPVQQIIKDTTHCALTGSTVSCNFELSKDLWVCNIDKSQIGQVIENIVINAQQAMPKGGTIQISAQNVSISDNEHPIMGNGRYVKISIKDTGIGISKKMMPLLFDPFFTTKPVGHGLGLATCYSIVNRHGGAIDVDSILDEGSTFHIYLPASADRDSPQENSIKENHFGSGKILIMDDEEVMRDTMGTLFESLGYSVKCQNDGKQALSDFISAFDAKEEMAAVVLDLTVPGGMGGKDVVFAIRQLDTTIPVFVASGYSDDPIMKKPSEYGFTAGICKPFRRSELVKLLNDHMPAKKSEAPFS